MSNALTPIEAAEELSRAGRLLHLCHSSADADAAGSAYCGMRTFGGDICIGERPKLPARHLLEHLGAYYEWEADLSSYDFVVVYDTPSPALLPTLAFPCPWMVVDHHPDSRLLGLATWSLHHILDSCCLVVDRLVRANKHRLDREMAFALAAGTIADTRSLRGASPATMRRVAALLSRAGATMGQVVSTLFGPPSAEHLEEALASFRSVECWTSNGYTVGVAHPASHLMTFQLADTLSVYGVDLLLAIFPEAAGRVCVRLAVVSPRLPHMKILVHLAAILAADEVWGGGMLCNLTVDEATKRCRSYVGKNFKP